MSLTNPLAAGGAPPVIEDVGKALARVQDDLLQLRETIEEAVGVSGIPEAQVQVLRDALARAEETVRRDTRLLFQSTVHQHSVLPPLPERSVSPPLVAAGDAPLDRETGALVPFDSPTQSRRRLPSNVRGSRGSTELVARGPDPSPGQTVRATHRSRILSDPLNPQARQMLAEQYSLPVETTAPPRVSVPIPGRLYRSQTVQPNLPVPRANRIDPHLPPPPITEADARKGFRSLIERGLLPPTADFTPGLLLEPAPLQQKPARLCASEEQRHRPIVLSDSHHYIPAGVRLDLYSSMAPSSHPSQPRPLSIPDAGSLAFVDGGRTSARTPFTPMVSFSPGMIAPAESRVLLHSASGGSRSPSPGRSSPSARPSFSSPGGRSGSARYGRGSTADIKGRSFTDILDSYSGHDFIVRNGAPLDNTPEFEAFRKANEGNWGAVLSALRQLGKLSRDFTVSFMHVDGKKLASMAASLDVAHFTRDDLLSCVLNVEEVRLILATPGRRFKAADGREAAATLLQSKWRMVSQRNEFRRLKRRNDAATTISRAFRAMMRLRNTRAKIAEVIAAQIAHAAELHKEMIATWDRLGTGRRIVVHIPSWTISKTMRATIPRFTTLQNSQMARLCDVRDPDVDVIYVCPVKLSDEALSYYGKLTGLGAKDAHTRFKIIIPENLDLFRTMDLPLSHVLLYSPQAMRRLRNFVRGNNAYIVPAIPGEADLRISSMLGIPIFSSPPDVMRLYAEKTGGRRLFQGTDIKLAPGEDGVTSDDVFYKKLASLVVANIETVTRWVFKIDYEFMGRGMAYFDVSCMECVEFVRKQKAHYGAKWAKSWAEETATKQVLDELRATVPTNAKFVVPELYPSWTKYFAKFLASGGVIEASPDFATSSLVTVSVLVEPNGKISMTSAVTQVRDRPFTTLVSSFPQQQIPAATLLRLVRSFGRSCHSRGVLGNVSMDLAVFNDPTTHEMTVWAVDLKLNLSDEYALSSLVCFVTGGRFDGNSCRFVLQSEEEERERIKRAQDLNESFIEELDQRYAILGGRLHHANLCIVHYSVFFKLCRAKGIAFDPQQKTGTVFTLLDSFTRGMLGMACVGRTLKGAATMFKNDIGAIHRQLAYSVLEGHSNFVDVDTALQHFVLSLTS